MLGIGFSEDDTIIKALTKEVKIFCDMCGKEAFIFQEEGNFCLNCWQDRTEPEI